MFVLSLEDPTCYDEHTLMSHKILGVYDTEQAALSSPELAGVVDPDVGVLLTDTETGHAVRVDSPAER